MQTSFCTKIKEPVMHRRMTWDIAVPPLSVAITSIRSVVTFTYADCFHSIDTSEIETTKIEKSILADY